MAVGESYLDRKNLLLDYLVVSRALIREVNVCLKKFPNLSDQCYAIMATETKYSKSLLKELLKLEKSHGETNISGRQTTQP